MECYCFLRHVQDFLADGKTPYERRFEEPFTRPTIPFGAMVEYHPIAPKGYKSASIWLESITRNLSGLCVEIER